MSSRRSTKTKRVSLLDLNDDILLTFVQWFEALELLSWGMACKRLHQTINSKALWIEVAQRLEEASIRLPLDYGDTIDSCSLLALTKATSRACRLHRNLSRPEPHLYRSTRIKPNINPFALHSIPDDAVDCVHIFDGRWIIYRRPDHLCVCPVGAIKQGEVFHVPVIGFAGWGFQVSQVDRNVALVTIRHDINETWDLMEITFGADNRTKPKVHNIDIGSPYKLSLPGSNIIFATKNGVSRVSDVYGDQQTTFDEDYFMQRDYLHSNGYLFVLHFQPGGRLELTGRRFNTKSKEQLLGSSKSVLKINLKQAYPFYPLDTYSAKASIRAVSDELLSIWHRVHMTVKGVVYHALFVIDVPYLPVEGEEEAETVIWGEWNCRASYVANGPQCIGQHGSSMILARQVDRKAALTVYPRLLLPLCDWEFKMTNRGTSLPVPDKVVPGESVFAVRVAWDDVRGIAVLLLGNGLLWVLHYA